MRYVRITVDDNGDTHFRQAELEMEETDYRPPAPPLFVSHARESSMIQFVRFPAGWEGRVITVPEKQVLICVAGELEITVSDGERRIFRPGDVVLMEDTLGKGHMTLARSGAESIAAVAPVLD